MSIAKNYLALNELDDLNQIVSMYLDYAEFQAKSGKTMYMQDWILKLDSFLNFNEKEILKDLGKVSNEDAKILAENEFEKFRIKQFQIFESDFDKEIINRIK